MRRRQCLLHLLSCCCALSWPPVASANDQAATALATLAGEWQGELYYLDYQSGERYAIPLRVTARATPDGATLIRELVFTDPGAEVHAVSLTTVDGGELVEAFFREGKGEYFRYALSSFEQAATDRWVLRYETDGRDDDRPARLRHTLSRDGDELTSEKAVRFLDAPTAAEFFLRNGTVLRRQ